MTRANDELFESALARAAERGPWRSLSELLQDDGVRRAITAEFPEGAETPPSHVTRRGFMRLLGASVALASVGAAGCSDDRRRLLPYVDHPAGVVPGVSSFYATAFRVGPYATGLLVESREGRPVKVEGNPLHPASLGAAGVFEQASLLQLYDPSRARMIRAGDVPSTWRAFYDGVIEPARADGGRGLCFLLEPTSSPLVLTLLERLQASLPKARVFFHAPLSADAATSAAVLLYGRALNTRHDLTRARRVLSLDDDFLAEGPFALRYSRQLAAGRRPIPGAEDRLSRLYVVEATHSVTGAMADGRLAVKRARVGEIGARVLREVSALLGPSRGALPREVVTLLAALPEDPHDAWARAVAKDLVLHAGDGAVFVGKGQPPEAHLVGALLNLALGNVGSSVLLSESLTRGDGPGAEGLLELQAAVDAGEVQTLVVLEGNPAYTAPADLDMKALFARVPTTACLSLFEHETAAISEWFVPALQSLEAWGDARAYDGTVTFVQPLMRPLYGGRTVAEMLAAFLGEAEPIGRELLRDVWRARAGASDFESWWSDVLRQGLLPGSSLPHAADLEPDFSRAASALASWLRRPRADGMELAFYEDPRVYDGRFTNNAWLLELPEPMTKLTWDNAAVMSPRTAARLGLVDERIVTLTLEGRSVRAPVLILPGHADDSVSVHLGFGRSGQEVLAAGVGFNAYTLRTSKSPWFASGLVVEDTGERYPLALTQAHWDLHGRPIVIEKTVEELKRPGRAHEEPGREHVESLYHVYPQAEQQWGMAIDLNVCTGCSSCVVACQAENNVPVVGKEGVLQSREMHWLRIDRYFMGSPEAPRVAMQPMLCQHCERAPCEYVCPVNATVHSADGLNEMIYNRCVGTRFCSNNCPYKVRRFNYFDYHRDKPETLEMVMNPEVTVRARGVMEKCTFCVQRIRKGQREARLDGRQLEDDEVKTACQQACPTEAIVFGLVSRPDSRVSELQHDERAYSVLHELGTLPRVRYLAKVRHPNEELEKP